MFRPIIGFAALGVGAFVAVKLLAFLIPALLAVVGFVFFGLKILLIGLLVWAAVKVFKRMTRPKLEVS